MFRRLSIGVLALSSGLAACDGSTDKTDGGTLTDQPNPAYWGLADKTCFHYDDGSKQNGYTIAVVKDTVTVAGTTTYRLQYRRNGFDLRQEVLEVRADGLVLWIRSDPGDASATPPIPTTYYKFAAPAPVYFGKDMIPQQPTISNATAQVNVTGSQTQTLDYTVRVTNTGPESVVAAGQSVEASKLVLSVTRDDDGSGTLDKFWFVPNTGIVQFQLSGLNQTLTLTSADKNVENTSCVPN